MEEKDKIKADKNSKETFGNKILGIVGNLLALIPAVIGIGLIYGTYKMICLIWNRP